MVYVPLDAQPSYPVPADLELLHKCRYVDLLLYPWVTPRPPTRGLASQLLGIRVGMVVGVEGADRKAQRQASEAGGCFFDAVTTGLRLNEAEGLTHG